MKMYLKESVYFEIVIPDGSDRNQVTTAFRNQVSPMFRDLVKNIVIEPDDLESLRRICGPSVSIRVLTERQALNEMNSPNPAK